MDTEDTDSEIKLELKDTKLNPMSESELEN